MEGGQESGRSLGRPKKNKKSYLQKAKRYGARGILGRGRAIDQDTYDYFVRVLDTLNRAGWDDEEGRDMFLANVFQQTEEQEWTLCGNQLASRVLEKMLPGAQKGVRERFMTALASDLRLTCTDPYSSHILEQLMLLAAFSSPRDADDDFRIFARLWYLKVAKFAINNWNDFAPDMYASHILRTAFQCLSGLQLPVDLLRSRRSRHQVVASPVADAPMTDFEPTTEALDALKVTIGQVRAMEDRVEKLAWDAPAGVVATLVTVLCRRLPEWAHALADDLIECVLPTTLDEEVPVLFQSEGLARILEAMAVEGNAQLWGKLYPKFFQNRSHILAQHPVANFSVQKMLVACPDPTLFQEWYSESFDEHIQAILDSGHTGVVLSLAKACRRLAAKQAHFLVSLMKALHCYEPADLQSKLVPLLVHLMTKEALEAATERRTVHIHGSLILQELLGFSKPIKVVSSLLAMEPPSLRVLLSDPKGSHLTDVFMKSATIGEKSREALVKSLHGELVALACSKHGSRTLDAIWKHASIKSKELIASELSAKEPLLNSNQYGKFIAQNCALSTFKRARDDWRSSLTKAVKKRDIFQDIIGDMLPEASKPIESEATVEESVPKKEKKRKKKADLAEELKELDNPASEEEQPTKKKKKKKAKSYLDDL